MKGAVSTLVVVAAALWLFGFSGCHWGDHDGHEHPTSGEHVTSAEEHPTDAEHMTSEEEHPTGHEHPQ
mgnify:CR=1 FL=1